MAAYLNSPRQPRPQQPQQQPYIPKGPPQQSPAPFDDTPDGPGFWGTVGEVVQGIGVGAVNGGIETLNAPVDIVNMFRDDDNQLEKMIDPLEVEFQTAWGQGAEAISQFAVGMLGAGKALKAARFLQGAGKGVTVARSVATGGFADFLAFDGHEQRLSNIIENTSFANPVTEFLAAKEDDGKAFGRFKNVIEGAALGVVGEALISMVKSTKAMRAAKTQEEAADALIQGADEVEAIAAKAGQTPEQLGQKMEAVITGEPDTVAAIAKEAESLTATPAQKGSLTRAILKPEDMEGIVKEAFTDPEKGWKHLEDVEFLLANNKRLAVNTPEEATLHGRYAVEVMDKTLKGKGTETFQRILDNSEEIVRALDIDDLVSHAAHDRASVKDITARVYGYKMAAQSLGQEMIDKWLHIEVKGQTPELMREFTELSEKYQKLSLSAKDITTASARVTSAGRMSTKYLEPEQLLGVLKAADGNPEKVAAVLNARRAGKGTFDTISEYVINGLLSSPKTHAVNITGNFLKTAIMPAEKILGGAMMGDSTMYREAIGTYAGLFKFAGESWKMAKIAWKTGQNGLDSGHRIIDSTQRPMLDTYEKVKARILNANLASGDKSGILSPLEEIQARACAFFGAPSRALGTMDEFFKQVNYRANVYAKLSVEAAGNAKLAGNAQAMSEYIENGMRDAFDSAGRGTDKAGLRYAQEATWTQSLKDDAYFNGGIGQAMLNATRSYPPLRLVMPFIRTPTNLVRDFVAHTPGLNFTTKRFHDAFKAGGEAKAQALGQLATGSMLWGSAIMLATQGRMTGGYPKDPATRQAWMDAGIEPYSFKIGDKYLSFARLDPFSTIFGIAADYAEYSRNWEDSVKGNWASGAVIALSENLLSKSYLTGLTDLIDALGDNTVDSTQMEKFMRRSATMVLPYSSGLRFARQMTDDSMREVRTMWDSINNAIPLASHTLPERRSWLTGKAVSHNLMYGENNNDIVLNELMRLGDNLATGAPPKRLRGVELDGNQYARLCELNGTVKIGGKTLHESLKQMMRSSAYDINRKRMADMPGDIGNPRTKMVEDTIRAYRQAAQQKLLKEDRSLQEAAKREMRTRVAAKRGDAERVKELLSMPNNK